MSTLDLASLPAPTVIEVLSFEEYYQQSLSEFRGLMGDNWTSALESDPVVKLLERAAYEKLMTRPRRNWWPMRGGLTSITWRPTTTSSA